ncbi:hypothetical protein G6F59_016991 [Rhizopus arrhizus]|nr:hypothetical protein G6F59_016991 [Rhizopus arrhizus]
MRFEGIKRGRRYSADCRTGRMVPDAAGAVRAGLGTGPVRRGCRGRVRILRLAGRVGRHEPAAGQPHALQRLCRYRAPFRGEHRRLAVPRGAGRTRSAAIRNPERRPADPAACLRVHAGPA